MTGPYCFLMGRGRVRSCAVAGKRLLLRSDAHPVVPTCADLCECQELVTVISHRLLVSSGRHRDKDLELSRELLAALEKPMRKPGALGSSWKAL